MHKLSPTPGLLRPDARAHSTGSAPRTLARAPPHTLARRPPHTPRPVPQQTTHPTPPSRSASMRPLPYAVVMLTIGLTGGVGSGKSTVAQLLADRGAVIVDADAIAREVVEPGTAGLDAVVGEFGPVALTADGHLNRPALAELVFREPEARHKLNAILHPRIAARTAQLMADMAPDAVVVHDVPLLVENDLSGAYELVIVVEADPELRLARLEARGMPESEARRRMSAQATDAERRDVADIVVTNHGDIADLAEQIDHVWRTTIAPLSL